ncbi:hypothetical protein [Stenotrophomonas maltophilia]|uniref:hypothetical protein n=1 Tax=Stenotrophomonas maltophilia TaxID=40324 RepID=UPI0028960A50|nr:hypothetical protein [Stenotrophomonas maltophilia]MDT3501098.1 hypothetical protein [Stenotrophomonas maltophilia]
MVQIIVAVTAGFFTLSGVWLGTHLNQRSASAQVERQRMRELQVASYSRLMGLRTNWTQVVTTTFEAKLLCEFYDARFHIQGNAADLEESKRQNERAHKLTERLSALRREVCECLGQVQIAFSISGEMEDLISAIYLAKSLDVPEIRGSILSIDDLQKWLDSNAARMRELVASEYSSRVDELLRLLRPLVRIDESAKRS